MALKPLPLALAAGALGAAGFGRSLGRAVRVLALVVALVLVLLGVGILALPSVEAIVEDIGGRLGAWTYLLVGVNAFLETGAFLGFIAPGETVVLFGGVLAGAGTVDLVPLIAITWCCAMLGDLCSYAIGRRAGRDFLLRHGARVRVGEPQIAFVERFFERHGVSTVFIGRWIGVVRPLVPFLAGSSRVPFGRFFLVDVFATLTWTVVLCVVGSVFWRNFDAALAILSRTLFALGAVLVVLVVVGSAVAARRSRRRSRAIERWIAAREHDHAALSRAAGRIWAAVGALERRLPGRRREGAGPRDTVPEPRRRDPSPPRPEDAEDPRP